MWLEIQITLIERILFALILYSSCLYLQAQLYKEDFIKERADRTNAHEEYTQDVDQYKAIIKQLQDKLSKDVMQLQENEDIKKKWDEERAGNDQQLRAYKRQVDDLRRQLSEEKERQKKLQESLEKRARMEEKYFEFVAKVSFNSQCSFI